jgi:ferredoxin/flavodoxin---NADP+ reductase
VETDVILVGAGPVGLYGAYYAGFRGLAATVVDALPEVGGQITAMYPEKLICDVAGFPAVKGRDLVDALAAQAAPFAPQYVLGETATTLTNRPDGLELRTSAGTVIEAKALIITGGIGNFVARPLPVGEGFVGRGLAYFVPEVDRYQDSDVVVVGGGDSALDWAQALHPVARTVTLVHRRDRFRAHAHTVAEVQRSSVEILTNSEVVALHGNGHLEAVSVAHHPSNDIRRLAAQEVVAALGFVVDLGPLTSWGLDMRARRIAVATTMETNVPRVYAAGDIVAYPGKVRLISVGFGEVALAVNNAAAAIDPSLGLIPGHSTDAGA